MSRIAYQLYSSRNAPLEYTLAMLAGEGYRAVEGYGGLYEDPRALRAMLDRHALSMPSGHFSLEMLEGAPETALEIARATGMEMVWCPWLEPQARPRDGAGWRALGARLQAAGEPFVAAGLVFGWHNHDFEFLPAADGAFPIEELFAGGPALAWEADIAWIARAGADPLRWIDRLRDRLRAVHVKDIAPPGECVDEDGWADPGHGVLDWPALFRALRATPASLFVMEHDNPSDDRRFARRAFAAAAEF